MKCRLLFRAWAGGGTTVVGNDGTKIIGQGQPPGGISVAIQIGGPYMRRLIAANNWVDEQIRQAGGCVTIRRFLELMSQAEEMFNVRF